jgi:hypothetical protein
MTIINTPEEIEKELKSVRKWYITYFILAVIIFDAGWYLENVYYCIGSIILFLIGMLWHIQERYFLLKRYVLFGVDKK